MQPRRLDEERITSGLPSPTAEWRYITFFYEGQTPAKGNYRFGGAPGSREGWRRIKRFEAEIGILARNAGASVREGTVEVAVSCRRQRCDLDNVLKATLDALCGVAYVDDAQKYVTGVHVTRDESKGPTGITVVLRYTHARDGVSSNGASRNRGRR